MRRGLSRFAFACLAAGTLLGASPAMSQTTLEFAQWWEPELPKGSLRAIMDDFEKANPDIKVTLVSNPYATTKDQIVVGATSGTLSDVVGLDGDWVNALSKQGAIADLAPLMAASNYDSSQIADIIKVDGKSVMFPVASFIYVTYMNLDLAKAAGVNAIPATRTEFADAAKKMTDAAKSQYGWSLPLSIQSPWGVKNDVLSWAWASGKTMMKDGKPDLTNADIVDAFGFVKSLNDAGVISPGSASKQEQDKVEEFVNGRVGMMIDSLAHVNLIRERNPKLKFDLAALPTVEGFSGNRGLPYAAWGIGIAENSKNKEAAWKLVAYLMSPEVNSKLVSLANAFPGNVKAKPDFVDSDEMLGKAFKIFQTGHLVNEFTGLPVADQLMRDLDVELHKMLDGQQTAAEAAAAAQKAWEKEF